MEGNNKESDPSLGFLTKKDTEVKLPRPTHVKNKTPAAIQITAEQILREARERQELEIRQIRRVRLNDSVWIKYAQWEESQKDHIPKGRAEDPYRKFVSFEKQYGDKDGIEDAIVAKKRRFQYEDEVRKNPMKYDTWFDYIKLEESAGNKDRIREVYQRSVANVPTAEEKRYWKRYIYLWINYALFEELDAQDISRTRDVYRECLNLIPHAKFSFSKIWLMAAKFEIRQLNLKAARQILGNAIGRCPKHKIFNKYIEIELNLGNIDRCRKLYEKYLEWSPENCYGWIKYAELEKDLIETERARAIFELAIAQPALHMPEALWKKYIDYEISQAEFQRARELYERLLDRTKHVKVWISYAEFEASAVENLDSAKCLERRRGIFERAINHFRTSAPELKEERAMLLEKWLVVERKFGDLGDESLVRSKMPKKLKRRRQIGAEDGLEGYEEYIDYLFPEETQAPTLKILEAAYKWKKQKQKQSANDEEED
ncbi:crooked neck-like protein 1 [Impatiens glandulifera]|uniref:crooked neck-like protein 1 n=1 Tax=Impatiens glandulifera TaxID=253017 RepID=UPI001FB10A41|nr:crooked neck-like protein 1 [Impatiens glandulifera]